MKVSNIRAGNASSSGLMNSMNMSNEFVNNNLHDQVQYKVVMKNLSESNDLADRFVNKQRVVKEKTSLGGFRIPAESLKKRVNPSDYLEEVEDYENHPEKNPAVNSFSFNPYKSRPVLKNARFDLSEPLVDDNLHYDQNKDLGSNLLEIIEKQVEGLKRESLEQHKLMDMSRSSKINSNIGKVDENKVLTEYISHNPERVQAIKHVTTQFKPEYMSLEELQKLKEEHYQKMIGIESEFYERKRKESENMSRLSKMTDDDRFSKLIKMESKHIETRKITPEELEGILQHENDYLNESQKVKQVSMGNRAKSARNIKRPSKVVEKDQPLDKDEQRFVKKYMNYKMKQSADVEVSNSTSYNYNYNDSESNWNKTKIRSLHKNGFVNRPDGLPGHLDKEDYSLYYFSIASNTPRSLSIKSATQSKSRSRSKSKAKGLRKIKSEGQVNKSFDYTNMRVRGKDRVDADKAKAKSKSNKNNMNSHLAFIKLIFNLLDKEKSGHIIKSEIKANMNFEQSILKELGFPTQTEFDNSLQNFPTLISEYMSEQELISFLLSRSELAGRYQNNVKSNNNEENNLWRENNYNNIDSDAVNLIVDDIAEDYPGRGKDQMDFLKYASTEERLDKLRESLGSSSVRDYNRDLTTKLKKKINSHGQNTNNTNKTHSNSDKAKVNVNYKDFKNFLSKYKTRSSLNFTIPKPFEFLKTDYAGKKLKKMEEILEERKRIEDEIIGYKFIPNELKREIFISQFENIIEAEHENRKLRTEKLKEKIIQNMRPFSFYEQDERKYKEKLERQCEAPQFPAFKANAVKWTSQVNLYDDILKKMEVDRQARIEQRKMETSKAAKLPPRMEMHEKKKQQQDQEMKSIEKTQTMSRSKSFKARPVKNFAKAHETFINTLEKKKSMAKPTEPMPFNFHEPKKKASLRGYLDKENDPQKNNPQFKNNIVDIIKKIQQKPKIEPASTKSLNLLMATRRKELEEKQRKDEEKIIEDKQRKEKQDRLKERVVNSKSLVNNTKSLEDKRSKQQEDFKRNLLDKKNAYEQELARRLQRVYNKPLMFEQSTKVEKFTMNKNMQDKLNDVLYREAQGEDESEYMTNNQAGVGVGNSNSHIVNEHENEDSLYEGKFE